MSTRIRKLIGGFLIVAFLAAYAATAAAIGARLPEQWLVKLAYYVVVGTAWGLPLIPLLSWMNRGR